MLITRVAWDDWHLLGKIVWILKITALAFGLCLFNPLLFFGTLVVWSCLEVLFFHHLNKEAFRLDGDEKKLLFALYIGPHVFLHTASYVIFWWLL